MPIIINPDGQTARFDTTGRLRLARQWANPGVIALDYGLLEEQVLTVITGNMNVSRASPWPFGRGGRALVPVSPLREVVVERFDAKALDQIDRPIHDALLAARKHMRDQWDRLMSEKADYLYRTVQLVERPHPISEARWRGLPGHPLIDEVDRRLRMLVEDGTSYDDVRLFSLGHRLAEATLPSTRSVLVCYGPGAKQHFIVKKQESTT